MADGTTVAEGKIKFREGKKWKPRWCVLKKPSPVADRLQVLLYKDLTEFAKNEAKPKSVFALDAFFGLDAGFAYDRESHVLAIICQKNTSLMAFELRENMIQFEIRIRQSMGEEHQFPVKIVKAPSSTRLPKDPVRLLLHDMRFCLIAQIPPKILLSWNIEDLRRFGAREGKFCFEGGSRCGKGSGVFALQSEQAEDIADIVNLASTGKIGNCHRKFKNRSSQIDFNSHLIADLSSSPSSSSIHHPHNPDIAARTTPQGNLPVTLNCCHDSQTGSAESEDWSWYKRHSVSVMDHRRIAALREKTFLDNREQLVMGIYDVPPNHGRKLDDNIWEMPDEPTYTHPRPDPVNNTQLCPHNIPLTNSSSHSTPIGSSTAVFCGDYGNYKRIVPREREYVNSSTNEHRQAILYKRQSASAELFDTKVSSLDEMLARNGQKDLNFKNSHEESLQRLKIQESDLQREMVLLDEMLQNCTIKGQDLSCEESHASIKQSMKGSGLNDRTKQLNQSLISSLDHDLTILSGNVSSLQSIKTEPVQSTFHKKVDRTTALRLNTSMPEGTAISPLFHAKLSNIPPSSHLNAPLPYVNLSKYDDESNSHVHLPGSADCVPVARMSGIQALQDDYRRNFGLRGHSCSFTSLHSPASTSSLFNISQSGPVRSQLSEQKLADGNSHLSSSSKESNQWENASVSQHHEILVVKMDSKNEYMPLHSPVLNDGQIAPKLSSDLVSILTSDISRPPREEKQLNAADIYENLPVQRDDTLPPELPPKGPALLKKLKAAASNRSGGCQSVRSTYMSIQEKDDNRSYGYSSHSQRTLNEREMQKNADTKEDNYLVMGSPKIRHKESAAKPHKTFDSCVSPHKGHGENSGVTVSDYIGMGRHGADGMNCTADDEIYLDLESSQDYHHRDLYISEPDMQKAHITSKISRVMGESTYMEMASMASKKNEAMRNQESPQKLGTRTQMGENAHSITSSVSPTPPPRPVSLKVRHNSDSGVSARSNDTSAPDDHKDQNYVVKPVKSPTRVYTKVKKTGQQSQVPEPPMPFPNLIEFTKKMSDSRTTYVNTYVDTDKNFIQQEIFINRDVPLPEPVKEGFLARFKRRSSKDKNLSQTQEKSATSKNRNSALERSMSEHDSSKATKEEKSSKLKVGRRRSSSFPNQLSYQESLDGSGTSMIKQAASSSSSFSSGSSKPKPEQSESSSSIRDFSDDSDMSPLLKRGDKKADPQTLTVLYAQRSDQTPFNPYMHTYKSPTKTVTLLAESSKTDDEKLIEIIQRKGQPMKPVVYQRSSSLDLKKSNQDPEQGYYLKLPHMPFKKERRFSFEKLVGCSSSFESDISCSKDSTKSLDSALCTCSDQSKASSASSAFSLVSVENAPPSLPPKTRAFQGPLSPVIEAAPPMPVVNEPIYVEMEEFLPSLNVERQKRALTTRQMQVDKGEDRNNTHTNDEAKAGRNSHQPSSQEMVSDLSCAILIVPVDIMSQAYQLDMDSATSSSVTYSVFQTTVNFNDVDDCINPAKSILRPRSGQEYVFIQRKAAPSPVSLHGLPSHSPSLRGVFSFENLNPREAVSHSHHQSHLLPKHLSHSFGVSSTLPPSPSISSTAETVRSSSSAHVPSWEHDPSHMHSGLARAATDTSSPASSPFQVLSRCSAVLVSPMREKSAHAVGDEDSIFFPLDMTFSASPPSSPCGQPAQVTAVPFIPCPIYVNQEFVDRHHSASASSQTVSTISSHSSTSPIRVGMHSLISLFFKDPSKHHLSSESSIRGSSLKIGRARSRHSESDANKIDKQTYSLPLNKQIQNVISEAQHSHSDSRRPEERQTVHLTPDFPSSVYSRVHQKDYDKFTDSSIISRRRRQWTESIHSQNAETTGLSISVDSFNKQATEHQHLPLIKSSGYKNIDCINAATIAAVSTASSKSWSLELDVPQTPQSLQSENILESHFTPHDLKPSSDRSSVFDEASNLSVSSVFSVELASIRRSMPLPHSSSPPPPLPRRNRLSSSPLSSCSLTSIITPSDISDSPPSYYAPSPPSTPPPPALPPRKPLCPPSSSTPSAASVEPETASDSSEEEQELNYIEIDMTKSPAEIVTPPVLTAYSRRSKRMRKQKEKDYAKLRYAIIDHRATKALQQTIKEHEKDKKDSNLRHGQSKDVSSARTGSHLSRINSAPASSKRKPISLITRERKLSSGSAESC